MIEFVPIAIHPKTPTYGGLMDNFSFRITFESAGHYRADVKKLGVPSRPAHIGSFHRFVDAARACENYYHANRKDL
jgi:hypothetical protein